MRTVFKTGGLMGLVLACCAVAPALSQPANKALAGRAEQPLTREALAAARERVAAEYKGDRKLCDRLDGLTRDVCEAQAKGRQQAALARLEARFKRTPEAAEEAKIATAEANYEVARKKCKAVRGDARDHCLEAAKAAREAAVRQAKVEKVEATGGLFRRGADGDDDQPKGSS